MSCLSSGTFVIEKTKAAKLKALLKWATLLDDCDSYTTDEHIVYSYADWEMYTRYPDVKAFSEFMDKLEELEIPFQYIRAGEDGNDIENRGMEMDWLYANTHTTIEVKI